MWWLWLGAALAGDPAPPATQVVQAPPERVRAVLADLGQWPTLWELPTDPSRMHVRGEPFTLRQLLTWSAAETSRGRMRLETLEEDAIGYVVEWPSRGLRGRPPAHEGTVSLAAEAGGTRVTWTVDATGRRASKLERLVPQALDQLAVLAEKEAPEPRAVPAVASAPAILAWQGFRHRWTYNHRINRSGDWWTVPSCGDDGCTATQVHAAASGSGVDRASFDGYGTALFGPGLVGWYGAVDLWFDGREGEALSDRECMTLPDEVGDGPVVLMGYDMDAVESADSLWSLSLSVSRAGQEVCAQGQIQMDCRTPECGSERLTTYSVQVPFAVATGAARVAEQRVTQEHAWKADDIRDEPVPAPISVELPLEAPGPAIVGLSGFAVSLDSALHTLGVDLAVRPGTPADGVLPVELDLFYVQWGPVEIAPMTVAQFAHEGRATLTADLVLIGADEGCAATARTEGTTYWPGKQADASVPDAEHRAEAVFRCEP